ncbi:MAG: hypothetical protein R3E58_11970 [Phycisphaerae bacterium]
MKPGLTTCNNSSMRNAQAKCGTDYSTITTTTPDIQAYLEQLVAAHPTLASMPDVGCTSLEGRTIRGIRIAGPTWMNLYRR